MSDKSKGKQIPTKHGIGIQQDAQRLLLTVAPSRTLYTGVFVVVLIAIAAFMVAARVDPIQRDDVSAAILLGGFALFVLVFCLYQMIRSTHIGVVGQAVIVNHVPFTFQNQELKTEQIQRLYISENYRTHRGQRVFQGYSVDAYTMDDGWVTFVGGLSDAQAVVIVNAIVEFLTQMGVQLEGRRRVTLDGQLTTKKDSW
jgi:energy-converting hydrogenase Eha subunit E